MNISKEDKAERKGLTLIELMVTLALVTIMVSMGYFSLRNYIVRERVKTTALELKSRIIYVKNRAFATSRYRGLIPGSDRRGFRSAVLDSLPNHFTFLSSYQFPSGVKFGSIYSVDMSGAGIDGTKLPVDGVHTEGLSLPAGVPSSADNWILFTPRGTLAWGSKKYVYLTNGNELYGLRISVWGGVDLFVYRGGAWNEIR